jgi:ribosomal protein L37E
VAGIPHREPERKRHQQCRQCGKREHHSVSEGVCDPAGGYSFTDTTKENFGKIILKRGHRVIELVVKYYF